LIAMLETKGWEVISADKAYDDPIFNQTPNYAGESLIYALAKDSGRFNDRLRYPAEDGKYEKEKMDRLGL
ncbi:MAG: polysaccharide deacetylase, partial [Bacteroidota bacterium]